MFHCAIGADAGKRIRNFEAFCAGIDPSLYGRAELLLGAGRGPTPGPGMPCPTHQIVPCHVLVQQCQVSAAIARWILDLTANLARSFALPRHLNGRQSPARMAGNALISGFAYG